MARVLTPKSVRPVPVAARRCPTPEITPRPTQRPLAKTRPISAATATTSPCATRSVTEARLTTSRTSGTASAIPITVRLTPLLQ